MAKINADTRALIRGTDLYARKCGMIQIAATEHAP